MQCGECSAVQCSEGGGEGTYHIEPHLVRLATGLLRTMTALLTKTSVPDGVVKPADVLLVALVLDKDKDRAKPTTYSTCS